MQIIQFLISFFSVVGILMLTLSFKRDYERLTHIQRAAIGIVSILVIVQFLLML